MSNPLEQVLSPASLKSIWSVLQNVPMGGRAMGKLVGQIAPYSGTVKPEVVLLEPGHAVLRMRDRRSVRNHLKSIHAIALTNLGEMTTGLAMLVSVPPGARAIITKLGIEFLKKARGTITSECQCPIPSSDERQEFEIVAELKNEGGDLVARVRAHWLVGSGR